MNRWKLMGSGDGGRKLGLGFGSGQDARVPGEMVVGCDVAKHRDFTVLIQRLIVAVEQRISPSGHISYNAPSGYHDDCVMALALANHGRWESEGVGSMLRIATGGRGYGIRDTG